MTSPTSVREAMARLEQFADFIRKKNSRAFSGHDKRIDLSDDIRTVIAALATPPAAPVRTGDALQLWAAADNFLTAVDTGDEESLQRLAAELRQALAQADGGAGWVLAPREPTEAMKKAGNSANPDRERDGSEAVEIYQAMLAAAHPPTASGGETE